MATTQTPPAQRRVAVKEMSWDPITRIVGSLGIHTEIDFDAQKVEKCYSTSMVFRGFDIFMKGIDPRDTHFITSRICGICGDNHCTTLVHQPEHGLRRQAAGPGRPRLQPRRDRGLHVRPRDLQRLHGERGLLRADGQGDESDAAGEGGVDAGAALRHPRLQDDRRHHAVAEPVHGRLLPGDAPGGALHARDVLPVRGPAHAPLDDHAGRGHGRHHAPDLHRLLRAADALHRLHRSARCRCTTTSTTSSSRSCRGTTWSATATPTSSAGATSTTPTTSTTTTRTWPEWGRKRYVTPGVVFKGELVSTDLVEINGMMRILLGSSYFDDWTDEETFVTEDPLGNPVDKRHPWNKVTLPKPQKRDFADKYSWVASPRMYDARNDTYVASDTGGGPFARQWVTAKAGLVDFGYAKATGHSLQMVLPRTAQPAGDGAGVEDPREVERDRARSRPHLPPGLLGADRAALPGAGAEGGPRGPHEVLERLQGPQRRGLGRLLRGGPRGALPPHGDPRRQGGQLPALPADAVEQQPARHLRNSRPLRGCGAEHADLRGERPGELQGRRHHAGGAELRPVPALRRPHVHRGRAGCARSCTPRPG